MAEMYPSLSRTTVYNALHSLTNAGLIKELEIESGCMRYDFARQPEHAHFKCRDCGKIFDMAIPDGLRESLSDGFAADSVELSFKGLCPDCKNLNAKSDMKKNATMFILYLNPLKRQK